MRTQGVIWKTYRERWMIGTKVEREKEIDREREREIERERERERERESRKYVLSVRLDDDDDNDRLFKFRTWIFHKELICRLKKPNQPESVMFVTNTNPGNEERIDHVTCVNRIIKWRTYVKKITRKAMQSSPLGNIGSLPMTDFFYMSPVWWPLSIRGRVKMIVENMKFCRSSTTSIQNTSFITIIEQVLSWWIFFFDSC